MAVDSYLAIQGFATDRVAVLQAGLQAARALQRRYDEGAFLDHLGLAYYDLGKVEAAIEYHEQALAIFEAIKSPEAERVRGRLAEWGGDRDREER